MSDDIYKFQVRMPSVLSGQLREQAKANDTSLNQEIVNRLESSLSASTPRKSTPLTAKDAKKLAQQGVINSRNRVFQSCISSVTQAASKGYEEVYVNSGYEDSEDPIYSKVIAPALKELEKLGYSVRFEDTYFHIKF